MFLAELTAFNWAMVLWLFALGAVIGSFLNVVIWRMPHGISVRRPRRSFCPHCENPIRWHDNVPVLSYIVLGGRCRDCGARISIRYPVVEALTGAFFAAVYLAQGARLGTDPGQLAVMMLLGALLIVASAVDVDWLIIPDEVSFFGILGGLMAGFLLPRLHVGSASYHTAEKLTGLLNLDGLLCSVIGLLAGGLMILLFALVGSVIFRREAMGFGDVKLMAMIGAFFGWKVALVAFFISPFIGLLYGIPLLLGKGEHVMPYGPFLSIGAMAAMLFRASLCSYVEPLEQLVGMIF